MNLITTRNEPERKTVYTIEITDDELLDAGLTEDDHGILEYHGRIEAAMTSKMFGLWFLAARLNELSIRNPQG